MSRYSADPMTWVKGTVLEDYVQDSDAGLYHITTQRDSVLLRGLMSRKQAGVVGLGGGTGALADPGDRVSFVINLDRAVWLYASIYSLRQDMSAKDPVSALFHCFDWTGFPYGDWGDYMEFRLEGEGVRDEGILHDLAELAFIAGLEVPHGDEETLLTLGGWERLARSQAHLVKKQWPGHEGPYELVQDIERRLRSTFMLEHGHAFYEGVCEPTIGFTATADRFLQIRLDQLSIIQAEALVDSEPDFITNECELRFLPESLQVIAFDCQDKCLTPETPSVDAS